MPKSTANNFAEEARRRAKIDRESQQASGKGSTFWPDWKCKNNCGRTFPEDTELVKCPKCGAPLIRYRNYQEKTL